MKHTPGPWTSCSATHPITGWRIIADNGHVADISKAGREQSINECKANARLIAASPNLLKALKSLARDDNGEPCFCEVAIDNPMLRGKHTEKCLEARKALRDAEEVKT